MQTEKKYVALTFDDGPSEITTPAVLDTLSRYGVTASFFLIGDNITDKTAPIARRAFECGCELQNHSKTHPAFSALTPVQMRAEVTFTSDKIFNLVGVAPRFFRPPFIALSPAVFETVPLGFICGIGCEDWLDTVSAKKRAETILSNVRNGDIILMHDMEGNAKTVEAIDTIIPVLLSRGYEFLTVSRLFEVFNKTPQRGIIYSNVLNPTRDWQ